MDLYYRFLTLEADLNSLVLSASTATVHLWIYIIFPLYLIILYPVLHYVQIICKPL